MSKLFSLSSVIRHLSFLTAFLFLSCNPNLEIPTPDPGTADFHKFIAVGGDYQSGYQDGSLYMKGQTNSLPALLAKQFETVGGGSFAQPLMPDNSGLGINPKPWESNFITSSLLGDRTDCKGVVSLSPLKTTFNANTASQYLSGISGNSFQNLSVPYALTAQLFDTALSNAYTSGNLNPYYYRFASNVGNSTVYQDAKAQNANFFSLWMGMEDIYDYARNGGHNRTIMSSASFGAYLDTMITGLQLNGAKGVIATIPDITSIPFYTTVPWNALDLTQNKADSLNQLTGFLFNFVAGKNGFVIEYPNGSGNYRKITQGEYILLTVPLDSVKCDFLGAFQQMPDVYVLDVSEVSFLNSMISAYNSVIMQKANQYGLALVDMNSYFRNVNSGVKWDGVDFNSKFVTGGFFSLDGYHPNQKGYALIANEFIKAINLQFGSTIPWVNCPDCDGVLFP